MELLRLIIMIFMVVSVTSTERNNTSFNDVETSLQELRNLKDKLGEVNFEKKVLQELAKIAQNISERSEEQSAEQDTSQQSNSTKAKISKDKKIFNPFTFIYGLAATIFQTITTKENPRTAILNMANFLINTATTAGLSITDPFSGALLQIYGIATATGKFYYGKKALDREEQKRTRDLHEQLRKLMDKNKALLTQYEKKLQEERRKIVLRSKHGTANQLASGTKPTMSQATWVKDAYQGKRSRPSRITQVMSLLSSPKLAKTWSKVLKEVVSITPQP